MCSHMFSTSFKLNNPMGVNINTNSLLQIKKPQLIADEELPLSHIASKKQSYDLDPSVSLPCLH